MPFTDRRTILRAAATLPILAGTTSDSAFAQAPSREAQKPAAPSDALSSSQLGSPFNQASKEQLVTSYRTTEIDGLKIFYREAGDEKNPVLLLLHGFPASSFMFRDLIARLSTRFRIIAPDYPGFGYSDAPSTSEFSYTFDGLAEVVEKFTDKLGIRKYALYMQDFGGPVGFRLASKHPDRVSFLIVQNANAYEEGLPDSFWAPVREL
jgi:hypothetical protein